MSGSTGKLGHVWVGACVIASVVCGGVGKMHVCTPWIGEAGLEHWGGLDGDGEEGIGVVSGCELGKLFVF